MTISKKRSEQKAQEKIMREFVRSLPDELQQVTDYAPSAPDMPVAVWQSKKYLVQVYNEGNGIVRLSINRTSRYKGQWNDKMTWDELQDIKRKVGYGDAFAVEVYPKDADIINVANLRHLWVLPFALPFAWKGS